MKRKQRLYNSYHKEEIPIPQIVKSMTDNLGIIQKNLQFNSKK